MPDSLRLIPVIDLAAGRAVHAVGGDREHYRPIRSILHEGSDPIGLACAYRDVLGLRDLYLADLNAIGGAPPDIGLYRALRALGLSLWVDAGVRDALSLPPLLESGAETIIIGLESVRGAAALAEVFAALGPDRASFSLDLRAGRPVVAAGQDWRTDDPCAIAETVLAIGLRRVVLLDLAHIGRGLESGTLSLLKSLRKAHPALEITVGGGVAGRDDLDTLISAGASCVLVASALHDGRIGLR